LELCAITVNHGAAEPLQLPLRHYKITYLLSRDTIDQVMHEILLQKVEAIRHAIDGRARFTDVADLLKRVTGDVQVEIARRISLLPSPAPVIDLVPLPEQGVVAPFVEPPPNVITFPVPDVPAIALPIPAIDPEDEARRRAFWEQVAAERKAAVILRHPRRSTNQAASGEVIQLSLFD
jgi:hypothetical protein